MRVAILSDIHGNVVALEQVVHHLRREATPDVVVVAGDLVAFGPRPAETMELLRELQGALFLMGNTDECVVNDQDETSVFTRSKLREEDVRWLAELPFSHTIEAAPGHELLVVHANPKNMYDAIKPDHNPAIVRPLLQDVAQRTIAFGHYHVPFVREIDGYTLVDVASVGMPRDGVLRATYALLTFDGQTWQVAHHRITFDAAAVARDYEAVGFPEASALASKLLRARY